MSGHRAPQRRALVAALASLTIGSLVLSGCSVGESANADAAPAAAATATATPSPKPDPVVVTGSYGKAVKAVPVDHRLRLSVRGGTLRKVRVSADAGPLAGRVTKKGRSWAATGRLEPGQRYTVATVAVRPDDSTRRARATFRTEDLPLDRQTYPSVAPLAGETVGVGMPVIVSFDVPVRDKATFERHMRVTSTPAQRGAWHWISDYEAHWRPAAYWRPGTDVRVDVDVNSVSAGGGVYGQESRTVGFHVGDAVISRVNAQTYQMQTFVNGALVKTTPITTGKPGFTTRSGVKVIMEKFRSRRMNSETIGISADDPEAYDIDDVEYAMRVTHSGEFLHAAPWSVGSQGYANVSHGCTGMSTSNAAWLYSISKRGDVVEYTGTDRWMTLTNGYGDWNLPFPEYAQGSALR